MDRTILRRHAIPILAFAVLSLAGVQMAHAGQQLAESRTIQFEAVVIKLPYGTQVGDIQDGLFCGTSGKLLYQGGKSTFGTDRLNEIFRNEFEAAHYRVVGASESLFADNSAGQGEYVVAGQVTQMRAEICYGGWSWDNPTADGEAFVEVKWEVYSALDRKVVFERTTQGRSDITTSRPGAEMDVFFDAFALALRSLAADRGLQDIVFTAEPDDVADEGDEAGGQGAVKRADVEIVPRPRFKGSIERNMKAIRANVVTVFVGVGHGSGFFIGDQGYLLTNDHVVGDAQRCKIRFESGKTAEGFVVARDRGRDVALVRVSGVDVDGLPVRRDSPDIGAEVYAVGSPLDPSLSASVSKGIVSAYRSVDGIQWIQSDVTVMQGNSGGPLLDSNGNVVGITSRGVEILADVPAGVNFFVPIEDGLQHLGIELGGSS